ncbi:MAG TPA: methyltransferase [bacterium]|nr:methyltransferase [bacterium]
MTSRTLVEKTLRFQDPPRIPRQLWVLPWAENHYPSQVRDLKTRYPDDLVTAPAHYTEPLRTRGRRYQAGVYVDEWGCVFHNTQDGIIGIACEPALSSWEDLANFQAPETTLHVDQKEVNAFCRQTDCFVLAGTLIRPFERLQFIRTMEQAMIDLAEQPPELFELLRIIHDHYLKEVEVWAQTDVDAIVIMDDWGIQNSLMVSPVLFRRHFKPMYADYAEIARRYDKFVFMHSDGHIVDIIEDLIEAGINALNSQIFCMGIQNLGNRFRGRLTFWGEIDRQHILPRGTPDSVDEAVLEVFEAFYEHGGVIAQCEFGPGAKPENVFQVFESWNLRRLP